MKPIHIECAKLTNTIYAGTVNSNLSWGVNKTDVTSKACAAVAEHVVNFGEPVIVSTVGADTYEITVKRLEK